jgi:hypothetical protein
MLPRIMLPGSVEEIRVKEPLMGEPKVTIASPNSLGLSPSLP